MNTLINEEARNILNALREHAEDNPISFDDLLDIHNGREPSIGDRPGFSCVIPTGFKVVFSIEYQPIRGSDKFARTRHASFSVNEKTPHPEACKMIMAALGFKKGLEGCMVYPDPGEIPAINVIEIIE